VALGPIARQALANMHFSKVFMGAAGITADGLYNANVLLVEAQEQMMSSADQVIVVADHTKFGRRSLARMGGWDRIDRVVSDEGLDPKWREVVRSGGADMILAPLEESPVLAGRTGRGG
jgi:DeoR/GlpR family transcriptional regulator of sugar metabolism